MEVGNIMYKKAFFFIGIIVVSLVTVYSSKPIHAYIFFAFRQFLIGYLGYVGVLLLAGIRLIIYGSRFFESDNKVSLLIFPGFVGIGLGLLLTALIGITMLLL